MPGRGLRPEFGVEALDIGGGTAAPRDQFQAVRVAIQTVQICPLRVGLGEGKFEQGMNRSVLRDGRLGPVNNV